MTSVPVDYRFTAYVQSVRILAGAGAPVPKKWHALDERLHDFLGRPFTAATRLADAVANPASKADLDTLRAAAFAEALAGSNQGMAGAGALSSVQWAVVSRIEKEMADAYAPAARDVYGFFAAKWDEQASQFNALAAAADLEADAAAMAEADDNIRLPWVEGQRVAARLEHLLQPLAVSAQLAGTRLDSANDQLAEDWRDTPMSNDALVPLVCDCTGAHRRRLAEAWDTRATRTGRWYAVAQVAPLKAADLDTFQRLEPLKPLIHKQVPGDVPGTVRNISIDPHDADYQEPLPAIDLVRSTMTSV